MKPFEKFKADFQGKKILVFGLGLLGRGVGVAKTFAEIGCNVLVTDKKSPKVLQKSLDKLKAYKITYRIGEHRREDFLSADVIVRNPSVPSKHEFLQLALDRKIPIVMDTSLFAKYFPGKIIGITGTLLNLVNVK